jgi:hypothetical protein
MKVQATKLYSKTRDTMSVVVFARSPLPDGRVDLSVLPSKYIYSGFAWAASLGFTRSRSSFEGLK